MDYHIEVNGQVRRVAVAKDGDLFTIAIDGATWRVDAVRVDATTWSLIIGEAARSERNAAPELTGPGDSFGGLPGMASYEVSVAPKTSSSVMVRVGTTHVVAALNRPGRGVQRRGTVDASTGPQRIVAPMPGKIVRVLVARGQTVAARQPLVVMEAMKMENELRAGREGTVAEISAEEGMPVDAGALLMVILSGAP